jgi:hypothetical protein
MTQTKGRRWRPGMTSRAEEIAALEHDLRQIDPLKEPDDYWETNVLLAVLKMDPATPPDEQAAP